MTVISMSDIAEARRTDPYPDDPAFKMSLAQMSDFILDLRGDGYMSERGSDGKLQKVGDRFHLLTQLDLAKLTKVANALNYFALQREREKSR